MRILVVEDDDVLSDALKIGLGLDGFTVDVVSTLADARLACPSDFAAIVLDITLPDGSGIELLHEWRLAKVATPVLLLTARNQVNDRINGLDGGADDYMGKPFDLDELASRLRALTRRSIGLSNSFLQTGNLKIDLTSRVVTFEDREIALSRREYSILVALYERPGHILHRSQIEERLYGWNEEIESNAIEVHIHNLRVKLGKRIVETVRGQGYRAPA